MFAADGPLLSLNDDGTFTVTPRTMSRTLRLRPSEPRTERLDWIDANRRYAVDIVSDDDRREYAGRPRNMPPIDPSWRDAD